MLGEKRLSTTSQSYVKQQPPVVGMNSVTGMGAAPGATAMPAGKPSKKMDFRSLATVIGLALFFVGAMAVVVTSLRQRISQGPVSPNAPASRPKADVTTVATCSLSFNVAPATICNDLVVLNSSNNQVISDQDALARATSVYFRCEGSAGSNYYFFSSRTSNTAALAELGRGASATSSAVRIADLNYLHVQCNPCVGTECATAANVNENCNFEFTRGASPSPSPSPSATPSPTPSATPTPTPTPSVTPSPTPTPSVTPSPSPTYTCNSSCTGDSQCQSANAAYICSDSAGDRCRLHNNQDSSTCTPPANTYTCNSGCTTNAQCQTANSAYMCYNGNCRLADNPTAANCQYPTYTQPSPTVGCNYSCNSNADCTSTNHICYEVSSGVRRCRHQDYPNSESCTAPAVSRPYVPPTTTVAQPAQPVLPPELPQTGSENIGKLVTAGLGILGVGALILLLL